MKTDAIRVVVSPCVDDGIVVNATVGELVEFVYKTVELWTGELVAIFVD